MPHPAPLGVSAAPPPLGGPRILSQRWSDVVFVHWRVDASLVVPHLPPGCVPDLHDGSAWVGLIAFRMSRSAFLGGPPVPWLGDFPEVNVRLYAVDDAGNRSVVFASLDADHLVPVLVAQAAFGLPYRWASMRHGRRGDLVAYRTRRHGSPGARSHLVARVLPREHDASEADDGLATFLTGRWGFHERHLGRTILCRNEHEPWPLQPAELVHLRDGLLEAAGFSGVASREPDSVLFAPGVSTSFTVPQR
ncbi:MULTISPECIES: YqjF family protein [unclassified Agrococcus]|uniref:YqjF family protein n=1 Tax=unclassified Agrococcus TaxID=2615065 RepID=UPI003612C70E